jgi:hypothetical protein
MLVTLSTVGTLSAGSRIGAVDISLDLPAGVSIKATSSPLNSGVLIPDSGVVALKGVAASEQNQMLTATYAPGTPNKLYIRYINATGLTVPGAFVAVTCDITDGSSPATSSFSVNSNVIGKSGVFNMEAVELPLMSVKYSAVNQ